MAKKDVVAMLLAGGQGSRLGILTKNIAKPAVTFGGKYRIIDFTLSNCINSGIDTVGVLTQYQPLRLNQHIGIGIPWDLDRNNGGVTVLPPHLKGKDGAWYTGTANAVFQNIDFIDYYSPEYVLVLSGDHIYKMDYSKMIDFHVEKNCDVTIGVLEVPIEEASRFGIMNADDSDKIMEFEEKPENPKSNLASMGIYVFKWSKLKQALIHSDKFDENSDFGKHIIPYMLDKCNDLYAYRFKGYWKDVGTIESYWQANKELIQLVPDFNLYEDYWKIYTKSDHQPPQYIDGDAVIQMSIIGEGSEIYGKVYNCVLGPGVVIEKDVIIKDSIIMGNTVVKKGSIFERCIISEDCVIGSNVKIGIGDNVPNKMFSKIYNTGISVIGEKSTIPNNTTIGKNCVVYGETEYEDYNFGNLESGATLIKEEVDIY